MLSIYTTKLINAVPSTYPGNWATNRADVEFVEGKGREANLALEGTLHKIGTKRLKEETDAQEGYFAALKAPGTNRVILPVHDETWPFISFQNYDQVRGKGISLARSLRPATLLLKGGGDLSLPEAGEGPTLAEIALEACQDRPENKGPLGFIIIEEEVLKNSIHNPRKVTGKLPDGKEYVTLEPMISLVGNVPFLRQFPKRDGTFHWGILLPQALPGKKNGTFNRTDLTWFPNNEDEAFAIALQAALTRENPPSDPFLGPGPSLAPIFATP